MTGPQLLRNKITYSLIEIASPASGEAGTDGARTDPMNGYQPESARVGGMAGVREAA